MTNSKTTKNTLVDATNDVIETLQNTVCRTRVDAIAAIYEFGMTYTKTSQTGWLNEKGLKVTSKGNFFSAAAKIANAEHDGAKWTVSDTQVSRDSAVCKYLKKKSVAYDKVAEFLESKSLAAIIAGSSKGKKGFDEALYKQGLAALAEEFADVDIVLQKQDRFYVDRVATGLQQRESLAVVVVDDDGALVSISAISDPKGKKVKEAIVKIGREAEKEVEDDDLDKAA